jgi:aspartyl-tRNA(Asn)/glutamyl-tRNA(Gln) amidotransferase subunit B
MKYETVIGLEVHVQINSASKIFSGSANLFGSDPNEHINPVCLGLPGALPVLNKRAVEAGLLLGVATECSINQFNQFARKHYFYPDLPKGYQISQFEEPIAERGRLVIGSGSEAREIGITRIHMEEDAGKLTHDKQLSLSLVDLNRAGTPLLEVVSEPELRTPQEAAAYMKALWELVRWLGVSDGNMQEGSLRCDANISLRPVGQAELGVKAEIKNINSFRFVEQALEYEILRQTELLDSGQSVIQETRLFDPDTGTTRSMRGKEVAADYRYFPDPDLPPIAIDDAWLKVVRESLPLLPQERRQELEEVYDLSEYDADVIASDRAVSIYFDMALGICPNAKLVCNWITTELFGALKREGLEFAQNPVEAARLGQLLQLIEAGSLSGKQAKQVFPHLLSSSKSPAEIVKELGVAQVSDRGELASIIEELKAQNPSQWADLKAGNQKMIGFFVGQVMKRTAGAANPQLVNEIIASLD